MSKTGEGLLQAQEYYLCAVFTEFGVFSVKEINRDGIKRHLPGKEEEFIAWDNAWLCEHVDAEFIAVARSFSEMKCKRPAQFCPLVVDLLKDDIDKRNDGGYKYHFYDDCVVRVREGAVGIYSYKYWENDTLLDYSELTEEAEFLCEYVQDNVSAFSKHKVLSKQAIDVLLQNLK